MASSSRASGSTSAATGRAGASKDSPMRNSNAGHELGLGSAHTSKTNNNNNGLGDEEDVVDEDEEEEEEEELPEGAQGRLFEGEGQQGGDGMPGEDDEEQEEEEEEEEYESSSQSGTDSLTWISWYCSLPGHEYFAEVGEDFIEDDFNLTGLSQLVPFYKEALEMVLDVEPELLYGLIHQRYIITRQGLSQMVAKYEAAHFGFCPRVYCNQTKVLPSGRSDLPGVDGVKLFCPSCLDTYTPPSSRFNGVDGAFFGTTFPHLLFQQHPELVPALSNDTLTTSTSSVTITGNRQQPGSSASSRTSASPAPGTSTVTGDSVTLVDSEMAGGEGSATGEDKENVAMAETGNGEKEVGWTTPTTSAGKLYIPRIYGFKVSERARSGPRMQWLRLRPQDPRELDRLNSLGQWKESENSASSSKDAITTPMSGVQRTGTATTSSLAPQPGTPSTAVRQSRSRQKLTNSSATVSGGSAANTMNTTIGAGGDDQLPPRRATTTSTAALPQVGGGAQGLTSPRAGGGQAPQPSPGRVRR